MGARLACVLFLLSMGSVAFGQLVRHGNAFLRVGRAGAHEAQGRTLGAHEYMPMLGGVNPASVATMERDHAVGVSYSSQFGSMGQLIAASYGYRLGEGRGLEAMLVYYGVRDIPNTLRWIDSLGRMDDRRVTRFDVGDYAGILSYGQRLPWDGWSVGGSVRLIYRYGGGFASGYGLGFEAGARYALGGLRLGAVLHDAVGSWTFWTVDSDALNPSLAGRVINPTPVGGGELTAPSLSLYGGYRFRFEGVWGLDITSRLHMGFDGRGGLPLQLGYWGVDPSLGVCVSALGMVSLRLGAHQPQLFRGHDGQRHLLVTPTGGVGVEYRGVSVQYAFAAPLTGATSRFTHLVSAWFRFDMPVSARVPADGQDAVDAD